MSKYKILRLQTTAGIVYTVNRIEKTAYGIEYNPSYPIKYFKTKNGAEMYAKKRGFILI